MREENFNKIQQAIMDDPTASNRSIAKNLGISEGSVRKAKKIIEEQSVPTLYFCISKEVINTLYQNCDGLLYLRCIGLYATLKGIKNTKNWGISISMDTLRKKLGLNYDQLKECIDKMVELKVLGYKPGTKAKPGKKPGTAGFYWFPLDKKHKTTKTITKGEQENE